ncbi:hypothetical protein ACFWC5_36930 [Streptomyces sp. NPDC060085]
MEKLHLYSGSNEAIQVLAAFMRDEPLPEPAPRVRRTEENLARQLYTPL